MVNTNHWQIRIVQLLSVVGIVLAYYLMLFHKGEITVPCGANDIFNCGAVSGPAAPYSEINNIPVALLGFVGYIVIFLSTWLPSWVPMLQDWVKYLLFLFTGFGVAFTGYLTYIEAFVLKAWCLYCVYSAVIILLMFFLSISYLRSRQ